MFSRGVIWIDFTWGKSALLSVFLTMWEAIGGKRKAGDRFTENDFP
jgi:hypothetical protein